MNTNNPGQNAPTLEEIAVREGLLVRAGNNTNGVIAFFSKKVREEIDKRAEGLVTCDIRPVIKGLMEELDQWAPPEFNPRSKTRIRGKQTYLDCDELSLCLERNTEGLYTLMFKDEVNDWEAWKVLRRRSLI